MRLLSVFVAAAVSACALAAPLPQATGHPLEGTVWRVSDGAGIAPAALEKALAGADVVILGEIHDNPVHHARQARLVAAIEPGGIAFEMVPAASGEGVRTFLAQGGAPGDVGPAIGWERMGWPDWEMYAPVFEAAGGAYIAGAGVESAGLGRAMQAGAAAAFGPGAASYGLDAPLPEPVETALAEEMVAAHCDRLPMRAARRMVDAQRLRDARFAHAVRRALAAGGAPAVLITGNGHARVDRGVPAYLAEAAPELEVRTLGQVEVVEGMESVADYAREGGLPYDYVWFSRPAEREDPCAGFRIE